MTNAFSDPFADLTAGLTELDRRLARQVAYTPVPPVPAEEIYAACKTAAAYYCPAQRFGVLRVVLGCMRTRLSFLGALGAFLLASGTVVWALCARQGLDPLALMTALAPCPVLAFIIRELQIRDQNLAALEKVCKYSPPHDHADSAVDVYGAVCDAAFGAWRGRNANGGSCADVLLRVYLAVFGGRHSVFAAALFVRRTAALAFAGRVGARCVPSAGTARDHLPDLGGRPGAYAGRHSV